MRSRIGFVAAVVAVVGVVLGAPGVAQAACPAGADPSTGAPRAAGDDPVVTQPASPTCDDAGYDVEFPDAQLGTDAAEVVDGGGATGGATGAGDPVVATGPLPVTGTQDLLIPLLALGVATTTGGVLLLALAAPRNEVLDA